MMLPRAVHARRLSRPSAADSSGTAAAAAAAAGRGRPDACKRCSSLCGRKLRDAATRVKACGIDLHRQRADTLALHHS